MNPVDYRYPTSGLKKTYILSKEKLDWLLKMAPCMPGVQSVGVGRWGRKGTNLKGSWDMHVTLV